jgi:hypothetical protein
MKIDNAGGKWNKNKSFGGQVRKTIEAGQCNQTHHSHYSNMPTPSMP